MTPSKKHPTVGMLHCGDMGSALATLLHERDVRVVTTCDGRSVATRMRATECGAELLPNFNAVVAQSDLVISLVHPSAAVAVASQYADRRDIRPPQSVFVDANSIGLEELNEIDAMMARHGISFLDASIHGGAARLKELAILYVSGSEARELEELFDGVVQVCRLDDQPGSATRMKLLMAGFSKCLNAMFLEIGSLAHNTYMMSPFLESCRHFYPGLMAPIGRMLPTYPQHAARRVVELESIRDLASHCDSPHAIVAAARDMVAQVADVRWNHDQLTGTPADIIEIISRVSEAYRSETPSITTNEVSQ